MIKCLIAYCLLSSTAYADQLPFVLMGVYISPSGLTANSTMTSAAPPVYFGTMASCKAAGDINQTAANNFNSAGPNKYAYQYACAAVAPGIDN